MKAQKPCHPNNKFHVEYTGIIHMIGKGKAVLLQAWSGPDGSRKLRFPDFMTTAQDGGKVVSLTHRPPLPPGILSTQYPPQFSHHVTERGFLFPVQQSVRCLVIHCIATFSVSFRVFEFVCAKFFSSREEFFPIRSVIVVFYLLGYTLCKRIFRPTLLNENVLTWRNKNAAFCW